MVHKRSIMAGMTDYTGVSLDDILIHLREWKEYVEQTTAELQQLKKAVHNAAGRLHNPRGIVDYIDHFTGLFTRFAGEFDRLIRELPPGVRQSHVDAVRAIYDSSRFEDEVCRQFKREHIERHIEDDSLRYNVVDEIYGKSGDLLANNLDLSNLAPRLQALVGTSMQTEVFQLKPNFYGIGVDFKALFRKCARIFTRK
jgi:hypothetical protein